MGAEECAEQAVRDRGVAPVKQTIEAIIRCVRSRAPKGWRLGFRVYVDDLTDAYRITGFTHRDGVFGKELKASYRQAHCITRELGALRSDAELAAEVIRCVDLVMTYLFRPRPAFRIGTKPTPQRLVLDRGAKRTQARSCLRK